MYHVPYGVRRRFVYWITLQSVISHALFTIIFCGFFGIFIEKTTFEKFVEIYKQIRKE